jgi:hypothetical protein
MVERDREIAVPQASRRRATSNIGRRLFANSLGFSLGGLSDVLMRVVSDARDDGESPLHVSHQLIKQ